MSGGLIWGHLKSSLRTSKTYSKNFIRYQLLSKNQKPIVVIGHSKGAAESLLTALKYHPDLDSIVAAWVLIRGAMKGSPICDYIAGKGAPVPDHQMPAADRIGFVLSGMLGKILDTELNSGF